MCSAWTLAGFDVAVTVLSNVASFKLLQLILLCLRLLLCLLIEMQAGNASERSDISHALGAHRSKAKAGTRADGQAQAARHPVTCRNLLLLAGMVCWWGGGGVSVSVAKSINESKVI